MRLSTAVRLASLTKVITAVTFVGAVAAYGQSNMISMTKQDLPNHGFIILVPNDPNYGTELQRLPFRAIPSPQSVIVKNNSSQGVVAFAVRFTKQYPDGHKAMADVMAMHASGLRDPNLVLIKPGASQMVNPDGIVDLAAKTTTYTTPGVPWLITSVEVDSVVFNDGLAFGNDRLELLAKLKAHVDSGQDLMEEVSSRVGKGEPLRAVLQDLISREGQQQPPAHPSDPKSIYVSVRQSYLRELSATEANFGQQAAVERLKQLQYPVRPLIEKGEE